MKNEMRRKLRGRSKIYLILVIGIMMTLCCACNNDYEFSDAEKLLSRKGIKADYIGEGHVEDERDTVWRFIDRKTGQEFQVIEDHYDAYFDATSWENSTLYTNYAYVAAQYYFSQNGMPALANVTTTMDGEYFGKVKLEYTFSNRDELKDITKELRSVLLAMAWSNRNARIDTEIRFDGQYFSESYKEVTLRKVSKLDGEFLTYALAHYDEEQLSFYSEREIKQHVQNYRGRVYIKMGGDKLRATNVISLAGNTYLYRNALRHLLIDEGYNVTGDENSFTVRFLDGETVTYSEPGYSYSDISREFGLELTQDFR